MKKGTEHSYDSNNKNSTNNNQTSTNLIPNINTTSTNTDTKGKVLSIKAEKIKLYYFFSLRK